MHKIIGKDKIEVLAIDGWLDNKTAPELEEQCKTVVDSGANYIIINCKTLDYISSAGIRSLSKIGQQLIKHHGCLILCELEDYVTEVFQISGLDSFLPIEDTLGTALNLIEKNYH